jgi:hypothetical protein
LRDVLGRGERGELSMMDAGECLGISERQFTDVDTRTDSMV